MDTFKLLTTSTKIQKSSVFNEPQSYQIPSAGLSSVSHNGRSVVNDGINEYKTSSARGLKRKRGEGEKDQGSRESEKFNTVGKQESYHATFARSVRDRDETTTLTHGDSAYAVPMIEEAECRKILQSHKIKVTILQDPRKPHEQPPNYKYRIKKQSSKKAYDQVFPQPLTKFGMLRSKYRISKRLMENLRNQGYTEPTEVQMGTLPLLLESSEDFGLPTPFGKRRGRVSEPEVDLLTIAPTGSGKTLCFAIHLINRLLRDRKAMNKTSIKSGRNHQVQALIIAPTHELADQITNECKKIALGTGIKVSGLSKGMRLESAIADSCENSCERSEIAMHGLSHVEGALRHTSAVKADILVSTPLTFIHAISEDESTSCRLPSVRFLVLDEADVLLDPLFREQTVSIWQACTHKRLRTTLWSATVGSSVETLFLSLVRDRGRKLDIQPMQHYILRVVVGLKDTASLNLSHRLIYVGSEKGKMLALRQLLHPSAGPLKDGSFLQPPFLLFAQTIPRAKALYSELLYDIPLAAGGSSRIAVLHSELPDIARLKIMADFRSGNVWILITTDLLSRGIDFRGNNGIINYDIPNSGAAYVHRAGRTGRQGRCGGVAITLYTKDDIPYMKNIANVIAASERAKEEVDSVTSNDRNMHKWLLKALPNVSKREKGMLKSQGVESRRVTMRDEHGKEARSTKISSKSGYDRRWEHKRQGAIAASRRRKEKNALDQASSETNEEEWEGIEN